MGPMSQPLGRRTGGGWMVYSLEEEQKERLSRCVRRSPTFAKTQQFSRVASECSNRVRATPSHPTSPTNVRPATEPLAMLPPSPLSVPSWRQRSPSLTVGTLVPLHSPSNAPVKSPVPGPPQQQASRKALLPNIHNSPAALWEGGSPSSTIGKLTMMSLKEELADMPFLHQKAYDMQFRHRVKVILTQQFQGRMTSLSEDCQKSLRRLGVDVPENGMRNHGTLQVTDILLENYRSPPFDIRPEQLLRQAWEELRMPAIRKAPVEEHLTGLSAQDIVTWTFWFTFLAFFQPSMLSSLTDVVPGLPRAATRELLSQLAQPSQRDTTHHFFVDHFHFIVAQAVVWGFLRNFRGSHALFTESWTARVFTAVECLLTGVHSSMENLLDRRARLFPNPLEDVVLTSPRGHAIRPPYHRADQLPNIVLTTDDMPILEQDVMQMVKEKKRLKLVVPTWNAQNDTQEEDEGPVLTDTQLSPRVDSYAIEMCLELDRTLSVLLGQRTFSPRAAKSNVRLSHYGIAANNSYQELKIFDASIPIVIETSSPDEPPTPVLRKPRSQRSLLWARKAQLSP